MKTRSILFSAVVVMLLLCMMPLSTFAASVDTTVSNGYYTVISNDQYALAPGATESEIIVNNSAGTDRKVVHVFEVDPTNENVEILPGYYGIDKLNPDDLAGDSAIWKAKELTQTVKYYEEVLGYNVVGAMNTALAYDSDAPYGYMVWDGVVLGTPEVHKGAQTYLAINYDGTSELRSMSTPLTGNEKTAISANFGWLVKDGVLSSKTVERTSSDASRSMIGIKADGTIVFCQVDGRNAPVSTGLSNYEMGEMMLSLGCVNAVNCDGGGSSTFVSKREGTTENVMRSIPSDGSERPTINSVIIVSKAQPTGIFHHATVDSEFDYFAPYSSGSFVIAGVDTNGYPVDVPANVTWKLSDASFGTVDNGIFTSNGKKGDVTVQLVYNDTVVGEKQISIVDPDVFAFSVSETVLPFGKDMTISFACTYGADDWAVCVDGSYNLALSDNNAATLNGLKLTATTDESVEGVVVTATYKADTSVTATMDVAFGKGSEILFDFENGEDKDFLGVDEMFDWAEANGAAAPIQTNGNFSDDADSFAFLSTKDNGGQVKNGDKALGVTLDYTNAQYASWSYNMFFYTGIPHVLRDVANGNNATTFGMWVYIPEGAPGMAMQLTVYHGTSADDCTGTQIHFYFNTVSGAKKNLNSCTEADIPESRWVYATADISAYNYVSLVDPYGTKYGREPSFMRFYVKPTVPADLTFYFDDFTLDYSSAVDDRVLPTISNISYASADTSVELTNGLTLASGNIALSANVADNIALDTATGKIYVDGVAVKDAAVTGKLLSCGNVNLLPGTHTITFEISDTLGNKAKVTRTVTVAGDAVITLGGHNDLGNVPEYGSIYYIDVNTTDVEAITSLTLTLKLQNANTWETEGAIVADGYDATFDYNEISGLLNVTLTANGEARDTDNATLVSIPVRVWTWDAVNHVTDAVIAPETQFATGYCPIVSINCEIVYCDICFAGADYKNYFASVVGSITVETMLNDNVNPWHYHTAEEVESTDATCTETGLSGRTYCKVCGSVVEWGTVIPATGHSYSFVDDVLKCACGDLFNGEYTDGYTYVNGVKFINGWNNGSYFVDGVKLTGIQQIDGLFYNFGEEGYADGPYTGLFELDGRTYYAIAGNRVTKWQLIDGEWYFFNPSTYNGYNGSYGTAYFGYPVTYTFTDGKLDSGVWYQSESGGYRYYYGPGCYRNSWATIDGNTYYFDNNSERVTGLYSICPNLNDKTPIYELHHFDENGVLIEKVTTDGLYEYKGEYYYVLDSQLAKVGLFKLGDDYYYASTSTGKIYTGGTRYVAGNCISESASDIPEGYYTFGADGKMVIESTEEPDTPAEPEKKNGIIDGYYYIDDVMQKCGLFELDGAYYYASTTNGKIYTGGRRYVAGNCISESASEIPEGYYTFGADGKMVDAPVAEPDVPAEPEKKNGIIDGYYYIDDVMQKCGLFELDGAYYYASTTNGKIYTSGTRYVAGDCISESASEIPDGYYTFGADGKMYIEADEEEKLNGVVNGFYYIDGVMQKCGLFELDGAYYYASTTNGKIYTSGTRYVAGDCISESASEFSAGYYSFGTDGKMILS